MTSFIAVLVGGVLAGAVYALIASGLSLIFGVMRIVNFMHGQIVVTGMFAGAIAWNSANISPYLAIVPLGILYFGAGLAIYYWVLQPFMRRGARALVVALVTLGIGLAIDEAVNWASGGHPTSVNIATTVRSWEVAGITIGTAQAIAALAAVVVLAGLYFVLHRTRWGRWATAVAQDPIAAESVGIRRSRVAASTYAAGAALAGMAGVLLVTYLPASSDKGLTYTLISFVIVVLGGLGRLVGAWVGALIVGVVSSIVGFYLSSNWQAASYAVILVLVLLLRPAGLFGRDGDYADTEDVAT